MLAPTSKRILMRCLGKYFILYALWHTSARSIDRRRREIKRQSPQPEAGGPDVAEAGLPPDQQAQHNETSAFLEHMPDFVDWACSRLDRAQQATLRGVYQGKKLGEIAKELSDDLKKVSDRWRYLRTQVLPKLLGEFCRSRGLPDPRALLDGRMTSC